MQAVIYSREHERVAGMEERKGVQEQLGGKIPDGRGLLGGCRFEVAFFCRRSVRLERRGGTAVAPRRGSSGSSPLRIVTLFGGSLAMIVEG